MVHGSTVELKSKDAADDFEGCNDCTEYLLHFYWQVFPQKQQTAAALGKISFHFIDTSICGIIAQELYKSSWLFGKCKRRQFSYFNTTIDNRASSRLIIGEKEASQMRKVDGMMNRWPRAVDKDVWNIITNLPVRGGRLSGKANGKGIGGNWQLLIKNEEANASTCLSFSACCL